MTCKPLQRCYHSKTMITSLMISATFRLVYSHLNTNQPTILQAVNFGSLFIPTKAPGHNFTFCLHKMTLEFRLNKLKLKN